MMLDLEYTGRMESDGKEFKPSLPHVKWILPCAPESQLALAG